MKKFHFFFLIAMITAIGFSFMSKSNFHTQESEQTDAQIEASILSVDSLPNEELKKLVAEQLVTPIRNILEEKDPHVFMTKCYSRVHFEVLKKYSKQELNWQDENVYQCMLYFTNCSRATTITTFKVNTDEDKITVFESFKNPDMELKAFLKEYKTHVQEHGVPGGA